MGKKLQISEEVERTLQAFDNDILPEENPFLLTRLKAERENRLRKRERRIALKLNLNKVLLILILLINLATLVYFFEWNAKYTLQTRLVSELKKDLQIDQSQNNF